MRIGIRSQLLSPVLLLLAGIAAISATTAATAAGQAKRQIEARLRTVTEFLVEESHFPLTPEVLGWLKSLSGAEYRLKPVRLPVRTTLPEAADADLPGPSEGDWRSLRLGAPVRLGGRGYLPAGVRLRRASEAGAVLHLLYPESLWRDARWEAIRPSLLLGACAGGAALGLALWQARGLGRRLREVEQQTRRIAEGDFGPMPLPGRDDEVRDLAVSVNTMARQLAQFQKTVETTERLRLLGQVSGGLAHQLRNGLTGARLAVQLFLHEAGGPADEGPLEVALRQLSLLETQVRRFLDLGRTGEPRRERCSLTAIVGEAVELLLPRFRHAGTRLTWEPPDDQLLLRGEPGQLAQLVVNLLDNAGDAAGPEGEAEVRLRAEGAEAVLEIVDTGPGPAAEVAGRLFEPFVTGKPEGVGLGLAVARRVAEGHGGRLVWAREGGRTVFWAVLPLEG